VSRIGTGIFPTSSWRTGSFGHPPFPYLPPPPPCLSDPVHLGSSVNFLPVLANLWGVSFFPSSGISSSSPCEAVPLSSYFALARPFPPSAPSPFLNFLSSSFFRLAVQTEYHPAFPAATGKSVHLSGTAGSFKGKGSVPQTFPTTWFAALPLSLFYHVKRDLLSTLPPPSVLRLYFTV